MGKKCVALCAWICVATYGCGSSGGAGGGPAGAGGGPGSGAAGSNVDGPASGVNSAPAIAGAPAAVAYEERDYAFTPSASDPDGDALSFGIQNAPEWLDFDASSGRLSGRPGMNDVGLYANIRISVSDGVRQASLPAFDIVVEPAFPGAFTLSWQPPTQNTDDSPLDDLDGFKIYWGSAPDQYSNQITVHNEGATSYFIEGLEPGTYYFATSAFNSLGTEGAISDPAMIVIR